MIPGVLARQALRKKYTVTMRDESTGKTYDVDIEADSKPTGADLEGLRLDFEKRIKETNQKPRTAASAATMGASIGSQMGMNSKPNPGAIAELANLGGSKPYVKAKDTFKENERKKRERETDSFLDYDSKAIVKNVNKFIADTKESFTEAIPSLDKIPGGRLAQRIAPGIIGPGDKGYAGHALGAASDVVTSPADIMADVLNFAKTGEWQAAANILLKTGAIVPVGKGVVAAGASLASKTKAGRGIGVAKAMAETASKGMSEQQVLNALQNLGASKQVALQAIKAAKTADTVTAPIAGSISNVAGAKRAAKGVEVPKVEVKTLYHGTTKEFNDFKVGPFRKNEQLSGLGVHFYVDEANASRYAFDSEVARPGTSPRVISKDIDLGNNLDARKVVYEGDPEWDIVEQILGPKHRYMTDGGRKAIWLQNALDKGDPKKVKAVLESAGYDSLTYDAMVGRRHLQGMQGGQTGEAVIIFDAQRANADARMVGKSDIFERTRKALEARNRGDYGRASDLPYKEADNALMAVLHGVSYAEPDISKVIDFVRAMRGVPYEAGGNLRSLVIGTIRSRPGMDRSTGSLLEHLVGAVEEGKIKASEAAELLRASTPGDWGGIDLDKAADDIIRTYGTDAKMLGIPNAGTSPRITRVTSNSKGSVQRAFVDAVNNASEPKITRIINRIRGGYSEFVVTDGGKEIARLPESKLPQDLRAQLSVGERLAESDSSVVYHRVNLKQPQPSPTSIPETPQPKPLWSEYADGIIKEGGTISRKDNVVFVRFKPNVKPSDIVDAYPDSDLNPDSFRGAAELSARERFRTGGHAKASAAISNAVNQGQLMSAIDILRFDGKIVGVTKKGGEPFKIIFNNAEDAQAFENAFQELGSKQTPLEPMGATAPEYVASVDVGQVASRKVNSSALGAKPGTQTGAETGRLGQNVSPDLGEIKQANAPNFTPGKRPLTGGKVDMGYKQEPVAAKPKEPWEITQDTYVKTRGLNGAEVQRLKSARDNNANFNETQTTVGAIITDPEILEAFPNSLDVSVVIQDDITFSMRTEAKYGKGVQSKGYFDQREGNIVIPRSALDNPDQLRSTLIHETTHAERARLGRGFDESQLYDERAYEQSARQAQSRFANSEHKGHRRIVEQALKEGKPVPANVLADYPDLAAKYARQEAPVKPPVEPERPPIVKEPGETTVAHADTDRIRSDFGLDERQASKETVQQWVDEANKIDRNPVDIANEVIANPRPMTKAEQIKLGERLQRIVDSGDVSEEAVAEIEAITKGLAAAGSEWGRAGLARQLLIKANYAAVNLKARAKATGGKVTEKTNQLLETQAAKIKELEDRLTNLELEKAIGKPPKPTKDRVTAIRESRAQALSKLKEVAGKAVAETLQAPVMSLMGAGGAGGGSFRYTGEAFDALKTLAKSYIEEGVVRFEDIVTKLKGHGLPESDEDFALAIRQAMGDYGRELNAGRKAYGEDVQVKGSWGVKDKEIATVRAQLDIEKGRADATIERLRPKSFGEKVIAVANTPRTLMASVDLSAPGRQGWFGGLANPKIALKSLTTQFKAMATEVGAQKAMNEIMERPAAALYKRAGLDFTDIAGTLNSSEEAFFGNWMRDRLGKLGAPFRGSERAYSMYLNQMRADMFDNMARLLGDNPTDADLKGIANYINVATGRGGGKDFQQAAKALSTVFFAPRFLASRIQLATGAPLLKGGMSLKARGVIAREYGKALSMLAAVGGAVYMGAKAKYGDKNVKVTFEPTSSDFAKIMVRSNPAKSEEWTRIDLGAGELQPIVFAARWALGKKTTLSGKETELDTYGNSSEELLGRFYRSKSSPMVSIPWSLKTRKDIMGEPFGAKEALTSMAPLSIKELVEGIRKDGWSDADAMAMLNFLGIGVNTYEPKKKN